MGVKRLLPFFLLSLPALGTSWYLLAWSRRALLFWGLPEAVAWVLGLCIAAGVLGLILVRPIPIKPGVIFVLYLLLFGLLSAGLCSLLSLLLPARAVLFQSARDSGLPPLLLTAGALLYAWFHEKQTKLTCYRLPAEGPWATLQTELRIALLSDVHMGFAVDGRRLAEIVSRLSAEEPDMLIIAGDLVDDRTSLAQLEEACAILGQARTGWGVFLTYGNHDLAESGRRPPFSHDQLEAALARNGIRVLDDAWVRLGPPDRQLILAGRHDASLGGSGSQRLPLSQLLAGTEGQGPVILVDHQPLELPQAAKAGVGLMLSGHTHGGQLWPANWLSPLFQPTAPVYGCRRLGDMTAIVSAGLGTRGSRLRLGSTAEGVLIRILPSQTF